MRAVFCVDCGKKLAIAAHALSGLWRSTMERRQAMCERVGHERLGVAARAACTGPVERHVGRSRGVLQRGRTPDPHCRTRGVRGDGPTDPGGRLFGHVARRVPRTGSTRPSTRSTSISTPKLPRPRAENSTASKSWRRVFFPLRNCHRPGVSSPLASRPRRVEGRRSLRDTSRRPPARFIHVG